MRLAVCILLFFVYACAQTNGASTTGKTSLAEDPDKRSIDGEALSDLAQLESPNRYVDAILSQQLNKIRSACDENKTLDLRIADIQDAIDELYVLVWQYLPNQRHKLSLEHRWILAEIGDAISYSMVFRGTLTKEYVLTEDLYNVFVTHYKFMNALGDSIKAEDFNQQWARDFAQGLGYLYTPHPE